VRSECKSPIGARYGRTNARIGRVWSQSLERIARVIGGTFARISQARYESSHGVRFLGLFARTGWPLLADPMKPAPSAISGKSITQKYAEVCKGVDLKFVRYTGDSSSVRRQSNLFLGVPRRTFARGRNTEMIHLFTHAYEQRIRDPNLQAIPLSSGRWRLH
jgi:hypothetical protein